MAIEQIELRLTTFHDLGDTVVTVMPTIGLMKNMKSSLTKFMPGADQELNNMAEMLGGLMTETFHSTDASVGADTVMNSDAEKILQEASAVAEQQSGDKFPSIPDQISEPSHSRIMYVILDATQLVQNFNSRKNRSDLYKLWIYDCLR